MKKWYKSKTLWANWIGLVLVLVTLLGADPDMAAIWLGAEGAVLAIFNTILRAITKTGLVK